MAVVNYVSKTVLFVLLVFPPLHAASVSPTNRNQGQSVAMRQLTPSDCRLAKTQCPTLNGGAAQLDLDPQLLLLRQQYEYSLRRMKVYFERIIDILIDQPTASPLVTLCANMEVDNIVFPKPGGSTAFSSNATSSSRQPASTTSTPATGGKSTPASPQPVKSSSAPQATTTTTTTANPTTPASSAATKMITTATNSPTTAFNNLGLAHASEGSRSPVPETLPPSVSVSATSSAEKTTAASATTTTTTSIGSEAASAITESATTGVPVISEVGTETKTNPNLPSKTSTATTKTATVVPNIITPKPTKETQTFFSASESATGKETAATTPTPTTTAAPTTPAYLCTMSSWSQWSGPVGFGFQVRERKVITPGFVCPERAHLWEKRELVLSETDAAWKENVSLIADNFRQSFLKPFQGPRDLVVVVDASGSVDEQDLSAIKAGIKAMIQLLCGGFGNAHTNNRLAIVLFSSDATGTFIFKDDQSPRALALAVDKLYPMYGYTCTNKALNLARVMFQDAYGSRADLPHHTLLITDGRSNCPTGDVQAAADALRNVSTVFAVGIGMQQQNSNNASPEKAEVLKAREEIQSLVSGEDPRRVFSLSSFGDFQRMVQSVHKSGDMQGGCLGF